MSEIIFCSKCGNQCTTDDAFCSGCGKVLKNSGGDNTQKENIEVSENIPNEKKNKPGKKAGIILLIIGALFTIVDLLALMGVDGSGDAFSLGALIMGVLFCAYGGLLLTKEIKRYGWGIGVAITLSGIVGSISPFEKSAFLGCFVLTLVFGFLLIKANIKK